jgi:GT2 family glycosyltransferase
LIRRDFIMNILIAVPSMDQVPALFCQSLATLRKVGDCVVAFQIGSLIYDARNKLGKTAIEMGADYVLWLDSDMTFPADTLERMLNTMQEKNLDILTGVYYRRRPPYTPVLFNQLEIIEGVCHNTEFNFIPDDLFEVGGCGFGCVLMKSDVLFSMMAKHHDLFSPFDRVGEDVAFCLRARECGYKIWADPSIDLGHCSYSVVNKQFYQAFNRETSKC